MTSKQQSVAGRQVETKIEIAAPVDAVWSALTNPEELARWFPLRARVKPGAGGTIWLSWGPPWEDESRIEIWEPNRRLRTTSGWFAEGHGQGGEPAMGASRLALDYVLEGRGGKTTLRLVHSGFGADAKWDDEFDGTTRGWQFELRSLRHYVERHLGHDRLVAWARLSGAPSPTEAWARLMSRDGLLADGSTSLAAPREGDAYAIRFASGDELRGRVGIYGPPRDFAGTAENLSDGFFRLGIEKFGDRWEIWMWLSTYDVAEPAVRAIEKRWSGLLATLFPEGEIVR